MDGNSGWDDPSPAATATIPTAKSNRFIYSNSSVLNALSAADTKAAALLVLSATNPLISALVSDMNNDPLAATTIPGSKIGLPGMLNGGSSDANNADKTYLKHLLSQSNNLHLGIHPDNVVSSPSPPTSQSGGLGGIPGGIFHRSGADPLALLMHQSKSARVSMSSGANAIFGPSSDIQSPLQTHKIQSLLMSGSEPSSIMMNNTSDGAPYAYNSSSTIFEPASFLSSQLFSHS
eukprot:CAMPEP_0175084320 /NCGR_PEP_ID=MMETSP0052_2-20121109/27977_1 /TAXON_ID=51329 ORGANISM="Polytomella parva, Strain SAG 63-3" /NCGR_SAMPLE_ID=MMETSP0052_2 /ASSEMBLY_ACC=CAM_ASM_000194 /LENGTH=233 /DNA_ID=CAMNT_0016356077 /DNA_START=418 /DNA_END=1116 /DNA_ORIENTATION=+